MSKKRSDKYEKPFELKQGVEWSDLFKLALKKPIEKKSKPKAKRAAGKKK